MEIQPLKSRVCVKMQLVSSRKREKGQSVVWVPEVQGGGQLLGPGMMVVADRGDSRAESCSGRGSSLSQCERFKGRWQALKRQFPRNAGWCVYKAKPRGGMLGNLPHRRLLFIILLFSQESHTVGWVRKNHPGTPEANT